MELRLIHQNDEDHTHVRILSFSRPILNGSQNVDIDETNGGTSAGSTAGTTGQQSVLRRSNLPPSSLSGVSMAQGQGRLCDVAALRPSECFNECNASACASAPCNQTGLFHEITSHQARRVFAESLRGPFMTAIHYRTAEVDGLKVFYRRVPAGGCAEATSAARLPDCESPVP